MDAGDHLLKSMLPLAVFMNTPRYQQLPWPELRRIATEASQYVAEHGDNILFKSKKKGDTAKAFNELAKGVTVLSFAPGGVTIFGMHFESVHPDQVHSGRWLYHSTLADSIPAIAKNGFVADKSRAGTAADQGRVYFTGLISMASAYARTMFERNLGEFGWSWDPVILRAHSSHLGDVEKDRHTADDWFVERDVPAVFIQVWVPEKKAWTEVREAESQGYFEESQTKMGEPGPLDVGPTATPMEYATKYIDQFWPKYE